MHPLIAKVNAHLDKHGMSKVEFACSLLEYMGDKDKYIQGTDVTRQCDRVWHKQVYRWFTSNVAPRRDRMTAIEQWLRVQKEISNPTKERLTK